MCKELLVRPLASVANVVVAEVDVLAPLVVEVLLSACEGLAVHSVVGPIVVRIYVDGHGGHILDVKLLDVLNGELPLLRLCT